MKFTILKNSVRLLLLSAVLTISAASMLQAATFVHQASNRVTVNFNRGWLYNNTDNTTFSQSTYTDGSWTKVCLPHTNKVVKHGYYVGGTTGGTGAEWQFVSWYRKHYTPSASYAGRRFILEFEGVATLCNVYVNGTLAGTHNGAYTPFKLDITSQINIGVDNIIAVQVDSRQQTAVPPENSTKIDFTLFGGIVRNVNLYVTDPLRTELNWVSIPNCSTANCIPSSKIRSKAKIVNSNATSKTCTVITTILDKDSNVVATGTASGTVAANDTTVFACTTSAIVNPHFWYPDAPYLYTVMTQVLDGTTYVDEFKDRTGFRSIYFSNKIAAPFFYINGKMIKLRGLNRHESFPFMGRAAAPRLQRKDADILKYELGCNIVRCSHYTQAPDFIKRCDEIGLMLIQEVPGWAVLGNTAWQAALKQDLKDMIIRDRNRPAVLSFGVRVNESADNDPLYGAMNDTARLYDYSRPTHGVRKGDGSTASFLEDIWTRNFATGYPTASGPFPWITTETVGHTITPQVHSWSTEDTQYTQYNEHITLQNASYGNQYTCGTLGWCAFDYASPHGNATTAELGRGYNSYISPHGVASIFRLPKMAGYFFQSQRDTMYGPMVYICSDWTSRAKNPVYVFSNCDSVELFLNGVSKGKVKGTVGPNLPHPVCSWALAYTPGTLVAKGYIGGVLKATHIVSTPSAPTRIVLTPDDNIISDAGDMTRIVVSLIDSSGRVVRSRADSITMSATGASCEFIGEARATLEGGQFAFYVKTAEGSIGNITCNASVIGSTSIAAGTASINVGTTAIQTSPLSENAAMFNKQSILHKTVIGNKYTVPAGIAHGSMMSVYDIAGRLLYKAAVQQKQVIDFTKVIGASRAVHVVDIETAK